MSSINVATRLDVLELFSLYCHRVDHGEGEAWAALFTEDGVFQAGDDIGLQGRAQLVSMPSVVQQHGGGKWRHQVTSVAIAPLDDPGRLKVTAYGIVTDWSDGGRLVTFSGIR